MSRIAKNSIKINKEINCKFENGLFFAKGKLGEKSLNINSSYTVEIQNEEILILPKDEKDKLNITYKINEVIEKMIKKNPGQWPWSHNRWK